MKSNNFGMNNIPNSKISAVLLDFIQPVIDQADKNTTEEQIEKAFYVAVGIWNALVQDKINGNQKYLKMMRDRIADSASFELFETFVNRKKKYFSQDLRMISDCTIRYENGYLHVQAKASVDNILVTSDI